MHKPEWMDINDWRESHLIIPPGMLCHVAKNEHETWGAAVTLHFEHESTSDAGDTMPEAKMEALRMLKRDLEGRLESVQEAIAATMKAEMEAEMAAAIGKEAKPNRMKDELDALGVTPPTEEEKFLRREEAKRRREMRKVDNLGN